MPGIFDENTRSEKTKNEPQEELMITDDRTINHLPKSGKGTVNKKAGAILILGGILLALILIVPKFFNSSAPQEQEQKKETKAAAKNYQKPPEPIPQKQFSFEEPEEPAGEKLGEVVSNTPKTGRIIKSLSSMMIATTSSNAADVANGSPIGNLLGYNYSAVNADTQQAINNARARLNALQSGEQGEKLGENSAGDIFKAPVFSAKAAKKNPYNSNLLLAQGTYIPCVLRGRLISNISGQVSCVISENVFSENGNVLLIEKGTKVTGFYQGSSVKHGHAQIFVVWQEARTPNNVVIPLDSGSTDELGANGLTGWVDNHFWDRVTNAIFLSVILDSGQALSTRLSDKAVNDTNNTREAGENIAKTVLEQMGDIAPTVYKNQGDKVGIFVARDVDFSQVYELKQSR